MLKMVEITVIIRILESEILQKYLEKLWDIFQIKTFLSQAEQAS